jgi:hypothetical protein
VVALPPASASGSKNSALTLHVVQRSSSGALTDGSADWFGRHPSTVRLSAPTGSHWQRHRLAYVVADWIVCVGVQCTEGAALGVVRIT